MLDLEELSGGGLRDAYAVLADRANVSPDRVMLVVEHEGELATLEVDRAAMVPVVTYAVSNMLEGPE